MQPYSLEELKNLSLLQNPAIKELLSRQSSELQPKALQGQTTDGVALISDEEAQSFLLEFLFWYR